MTMSGQCSSAMRKSFVMEGGKPRTAKEEKQAQFVSDWVEQKIGSTFIQLEGYDTCPNLMKWERKEIKP